MRTTVDLSETLVSKARTMYPGKTKKSLLEEGLRLVIEKYSAQEISKYRGSIPDIDIDLHITRDRCNPVFS